MRNFFVVLKKTVNVVFLSALALQAFDPLADAQEMLPEAQMVFGKYSECVIKIQVVENNSGAKAVIGSGFFVSGDGYIITNYHVISKLLLHPDRYRAELVDTAGAKHILSVIGVDVINDLALVKTNIHDVPFLKTSLAELQQGTRLYSLGFPKDIGLSIIEGTYNGLLKHALYRKIHFTAPINPGMSGGPAVNASGEVVGVNVSSEGNEISFLVPAEAVTRLIASKINSAGKAQQNFLKDIRQQILDHQNLYFTDDLIKYGQTTLLGNYSLPGQLSPFFKCWGDSERTEKFPYQILNYNCSTDDYIYISGEHYSGVISFSHRYITSADITSFRFYSIYSDFFTEKNSNMFGDEEEVTKFECKSENVRQGKITFKTAFCIRGYRKLNDLYDVVFKAAILGSKNSGLETKLEISGVTFEKAVSMTKKYMEMITWAK